MHETLLSGLTLAASGPEIPSVDEFLPPEILFQGTPFAMNRIILVRVIMMVIMLIVLGVSAAKAKLIPGRWQGFIEWGIEYVRDKIVYEVMGETRGKRYVPMITTLFFTILRHYPGHEHRRHRDDHDAVGVRVVDLRAVLAHRLP